jgi:hypothetical protein
MVAESRHWASALSLQVSEFLGSMDIVAGFFESYAAKAAKPNQSLSCDKLGC